MDTSSLYTIGYGLYILSSNDGTKHCGCVINTVSQITDNPNRIMIAVNKQNHTHDAIMHSGKACITVLSKDVTFDFIKGFGFRSSRDCDKFDDIAYDLTASGLPYITDYACAYICGKVTSAKDFDTHTMFIIEPDDGEILSGKEAVTYAFYHKFIKPTAPAQKKQGYVCSICGYIHEGDDLPADFICPICKHGAEVFERIGGSENNKTNSTKNSIIGGKNTMKKYVCPVCGYVHEGTEAPEFCPVCKVSGAKFIEQTGEMKLAAEHEFGIYEKTVRDNADISAEDKQYILEQLMANFTGECSEVGMYLCMARIAHREGYPEIGLYWEKAAYEEAEHAAKFAELLGSTLEPNMKATTKDNLAWRVDCEFGATQGKFDLAACAKKNGLDAIHDTVHEMARDEARHGKALKGLLERYFG